jgi:class 3 adenylate cyclase/tetratricopeptide (TPR) repeat protein
LCVTGDREQLERAIAAQESLRGAVPDDVLDVAVDVLRRQLADLDAGASRRRQVTVLFADVSGFTAMSERMDAELVAGLMNAIWARLDLVVAQHGGRVDKHIGDAVMAVWGAEATQEDDPERAVRAGLALQIELAAFNASAGVALAMRVGISTGLAHLGVVGTTAESTVMGDTVNMASRLEHMAPVNGVLVSHETYRSVRGVFDVRALGEVEVRGKQEPVRLYVIERAKQLAFRMPTRGVEGVETRMIGRDDELGVLRESFERVAAGAGAAVVVVVADAGTGKSRLLYEFLSWLELVPSETWMFTGRAFASRRGTALGLFRDVIATRFDMLDSDAAPTVAEKLRRGFAPCLSTEQAEIVGHWLGFELSSSAAVQDLLGPQFAATARTHLLEFFASLAATDPVVFALEDLHWADDESLDLLDELTSRLREQRVLVVGLTRPSLLDRRPDGPGRDVPVDRLDLARLSDDDCRTFVLDVLQRVETIPADLVELVVERAEGNAFFVEELIKMLIDDGAIVTSDDGVWRVDLARLQRSAIPSTLTGVLQARLDTLDARHRRMLQCASVVGRIFWDDAVSALTRDEGFTKEALDDARSRELVFRRDHTSFEDVGEYLFKHALLCDVAYETVLLRDRPTLHLRTAEWLESAAGERMVEYHEMIAGHLRAAGEPGRAADHLWHAGQTLIATGTSGAAARSIRAAVELWDDADVDVPCDALLVLVEALLRLDDISAAETYLERARASAATPSQRVDIARLLSLIAGHRGDLDYERSLLERALPLAEQADTLSRTRVLILLAWSYSQADRLDEAGDHARRALALAEELGDVGETCRALAASAMVRIECGDLDAGQRFVERELAIAERSGNLDEQARAQSNLGVVLHLRGDAEGVDEHYRAAIDHYRQSRALHQRLGATDLPIRDRLNMAQACTRLGRDAEAGALIRESLATAVEVSATSLQYAALVLEADRLLTSGDTRTGLAYLGLLRRTAAMGSMEQHEAQRILERVPLGPDAIERGLSAGEALDLDRVIEELLAGRA